MVVVRTSSRRRALDRIVVGIDGSPAATAALWWACDEADDRDAELYVVHVWDYLYPPEMGFSAAPDWSPGRRRSVYSKRPPKRLVACARCPVEDILVEGSPATELAARSHRADLLVVGSRGTSQVRASLFDSVSQAVGADSACPTVIVRADRH